MHQFSGNGSPVQLEVISGLLLYIDPGYFEEISSAYDEIKGISRSDVKEFIQKVEQHVFPYGGGSLLGLQETPADSRIFELNIAAVTSYDEDEPEGELIEKQAVEKTIPAFAVDSASFLIIDMANFEALLPLLHVDNLFNAEEEVTNYIEKINNSLGNKGWAFVYSPGIGKVYDFQGDGSYYIKG